jgi:hypothetical protein
VRFPSQHSSPVGDWYADSLWQMRRGYLDLSTYLAVQHCLTSVGVNHLKMRPKAASSRVTATDRPSEYRSSGSKYSRECHPIRCSSAFQYPVLLILYTHTMSCTTQPSLIRSQKNASEAFTSSNLCVGSLTPPLLQLWTSGDHARGRIVLRMYHPGFVGAMTDW